jgi:signal peptidase II
VENRGAAFGIFQGHTATLSAITGVLLAALTLAILLGKIKPDYLLWTFSVGLAGGVGNLTDRVLRGFVVDYLDFSALFGFPVFNLADVLVVCATFSALIYFMWLEPKSAQKSPPETAGESDAQP